MKEKVWLTRDQDLSKSYAVFTGPKPKLIHARWEVVIRVGGSTFLKEMCGKQFHAFCNIRLEKGQCVQVKLTHLKNGFKFEVIH